MKTEHIGMFQLIKVTISWLIARHSIKGSWGEVGQWKAVRHHDSGSRVWDSESDNPGSKSQLCLLLSVCPKLLLCRGLVSGLLWGGHEVMQVKFTLATANTYPTLGLGPETILGLSHFILRQPKEESAFSSSSSPSSSSFTTYTHFISLIESLLMVHKMF